MTLDREAARALFANAEPTPTPADIGPTTTAYASGVRPTIESDPAPFAATSPFARPVDADGPSRSSVRKGVDWRIAAPLGVAAVCVGAIALFALPDNKGAEQGRDVATADIVAPPVAPPLATTPVAPIETAAVAPAPAVTPAPTVQRAATPRPAARQAPARQVAERSAPAAAAPSASDPANSSYASVTAPVAPPPPSLGAPVTVTPTPAPQPAPEPIPATPTEPQ